MEQEPERRSPTEQWLDDHKAAAGAVGTLFFVAVLLLATNCWRAALTGPMNWSLVWGGLQTVVSLASPWLVWWQVKESQRQAAEERHAAVLPDLTYIQLACHAHHEAGPDGAGDAFDLTWSFRNDGEGPAKQITGQYQPVGGAPVPLLPPAQTLPQGDTGPCKLAGLPRPANGYLVVTWRDRLGWAYRDRLQIVEQAGRLRVVDEKRGLILLEHSFGP